MTDELYINGSLVDTEDVEIVRTYKTPFFSDVTQLRNDGTLTIRLPRTARNTAVFEACFRTDFVSDLPYDFLYADYYFNGLPIFLHAEVRILPSDTYIEIQCVYGIDRDALLPLFEKKLNEITVNGATITEDDWVVNWNNGDGSTTGMWLSDKKYQYIDSVSGKRVSDIETISGILQPKIEPEEPAKSNLKQMTMHPFISFENILDLIINANTTTKTCTTIIDISQSEIEFDGDLTGIKVGDYVNKIDGVDVSSLGIIVESINESQITFNQDVSYYFNIGDDWEFFVTTLASSIFDSIKNRLNYKGIILSGEKEGIIYEKTSNIEDDFHIDQPNGLIDLSSLISEYPQIQVIPTSTDKIHIDKNIINGNSISIYVKITDAVRSEYSADVNLRLFNGSDYSDINIPVISDIPPTPPNIYRVYVRELTYSIDIDAVTDISLVSSSTSSPHNVTINDLIITYKYNKPFFGYVPILGFYHCISNMPMITCAEFIQQMLVHTGLFIGYDSTGALKTFSLDTFKDYIDDADIIDWTGKISNIRKGTFQFNSNAQKNYIKFANDKDLNADRKETIEVNDKTLPTERDMYVLEFDSPLGLVDEKSEMILYEQSVKRSGDTGVSFENKYVGDSWNNGFVINDAGVAKNIESADPTYYTVYKKLVERPLVLECDVNLSIYESANINFEKPIYCDEIGRYCMLLELQAPKYDVCVAKLLVVNQKL